MLDVDEATPLVDYKGSSFGEIMVEMVPTMGGVRADVDEVEVRRGKITKWSSAKTILSGAARDDTDDDTDDECQQI